MKCVSLQEIEKKLKQLNRYRIKVKAKDKKLYNTINKAYKKIDWNKQWLRKSDLDEIIPNSVCHVLRKMRNEGMVKCFNRELYKTSNFEGLFLLQEQMCQMDDEYWYDAQKSQYKIEYKPFHFDSAYRGDIYLFSYPKSREWKAELLTEFLHTKEFLFDEDSPHWKGMKKLRYFCLKNLMNSKVEKWEYQVQRFLAKKD